MADRLTLPTRNVVSTVSHGDQRFIKWFEDTSTAVNALANLSGGSGGLLDMGDRITGTSEYDGGNRV